MNESKQQEQPKQLFDLISQNANTTTVTADMINQQHQQQNPYHSQLEQIAEHVQNKQGDSTTKTSFSSKYSLFNVCHKDTYFLLNSII